MLIIKFYSPCNNASTIQNNKNVIIITVEAQTEVTLMFIYNRQTLRRSFQIVFKYIHKQRQQCPTV